VSDPTQAGASPVPRAEPSSPSSPGGLPSGAPDESARGSVLIVEADPWFSEFLSQALSRRFPSLVLSAAGGVQEAVSLAERVRPTLVLTGVHLGDGRGFDLTRDLRARAVGAKVVLLSAFDLPEYRDEARRCGADHFLSKCSFRLEDLAVLVRAATAAGRVS